MSSEKKETIEECIQRDKQKIVLKDAQKYIDFYNIECDRKKYKAIRKYFGVNKKTINNLLEALYNLVSEQYKTKNRIELSFLDFLNYFSRDTTGRKEDKEKFNFKRQHAFEAICRVLLVLNYDNDYWGSNKVFFEKLENYKNDTSSKKTKDEIINSDVNDSNSAGSVDIFFKIPGSNVKKYDASKEPCDEKYIIGVNSDTEADKNKNTVKDLYIMIQNKFYTNEYTSANKYDVHTILNKAAKLDDEEFKNANKKLVLMVNNKQDLLNRIKWTNLVPSEDILGVVEINNWFREMLYDMLQYKTYKKYIDARIGKKETTKLTIEPRFHQRFFINSTLKHISETRSKKFIWGAVPRSGKSFMIGGLIKERKNDIHTVIIILGAKTETEEQFLEMFCKYDDFKDFGIITANPKRKWDNSLISSCKNLNKEQEKNIILLSQEKLKVNLSDETSKQREGAVTMATKFWDNYEKFIDEKNIPNNKSIDIYFDEIHKGGSTVKAEEYVMRTLIERATKDKIGIFAMVTATYAKPTIAYGSIIDTKAPIIITWTYNDQQTMKKISDPFFKRELIETREDKIQKEIFEKLFKDYELMYQEQYLRVLEEQYSKHPELVLCNPGIINSKNTYGGLTKNTFHLKCDAISTNDRDLGDAEKIFSNKQGVVDLINFIGNYKKESGGIILDTNSIYGKLKHDFDFDIINKRHSQLWFLPYSDLYVDSQECRDYLKEKYGDKFLSKVQTNDYTGEESKNNSNNSKNTDIKINKGSLPNIEPLTRGLTLLLLENELFRENFCFLIVHGQKLVYIKPGNKETQSSQEKGTINSELFGNNCVYFSSNNKKSINTFIKETEKETVKQNKSLIILTGTMLRLGISLPCADIAFNFDYIQSIDLNYQTMFRVLTERENKKYGYYFDFNPNRPQKFIYEFNQRYNKQATKPDETIDQLQSLLYLFNYNGLGIIKQDAIKQLKIYETMKQDLKLTEQGYYEYIFKEGGEKAILTQLLKHPLDESIKNKIKTANLDIQRDFIPKITHIGKKGEKQKKLTRKKRSGNDGNNDNGNNNNNNGNENNNSNDFFDEKDIALILNDYTAIMALFSDENSYNCKDISDCIKKIKEMTEKNICKCLEKINVLGCFMKRVKEYTPKQFMKSLDIYLEIIQSNAEIENTVNIIFTIIKEELNKGNTQNKNDKQNNKQNKTIKTKTNKQNKPKKKTVKKKKKLIIMSNSNSKK